MEKLRTNYYCMIEISQIDRSSGVQRWYGSVARFIQTKHVNAVQTDVSKIKECLNRRRYLACKDIGDNLKIEFGRLRRGEGRNREVC